MKEFSFEQPIFKPFSAKLSSVCLEISRLLRCSSKHIRALRKNHTSRHLQGKAENRHHRYSLRHQVQNQSALTLSRCHGKIYRLTHRKDNAIFRR